MLKNDSVFAWVVAGRDEWLRVAEVEVEAAKEGDVEDEDGGGCGGAPPRRSFNTV